MALLLLLKKEEAVGVSATDIPITIADTLSITDAIATAVEDNVLEIMIASDLNNLADAISKYCPGALPAYDSAGAATTNIDPNTTYDVVCPATVASGDLLILHCVNRNLDVHDETIVVNTAGWTTLAKASVSGLNIQDRVFTGVFYKIAVGDEDGTNISVTCTSSDNDADDSFLGRIYRFTAANGFHTTPIVSLAVLGANDSPRLAPTVTPTGINQLGVCLGSGDSNDPVATVGDFTGESGGDWIQALETAGGVGVEILTDVQTANLSSGAAISGGSDAFTATPDDWVTIAFALVPGSK